MNFKDYKQEQLEKDILTLKDQMKRLHDLAEEIDNSVKSWYLRVQAQDREPVPTKK